MGRTNWPEMDKVQSSNVRQQATAKRRVDEEREYRGDNKGDHIQGTNSTICVLCRDIIQMKVMTQ